MPTAASPLRYAEGLYRHMLESEIAALPEKLATVEALAGLALLTGQCVLWFIFRFVVRSGPWHAEPGFTAHQLMYFPVGVYTAYYGCVHFFGNHHTTAASRVLDYDPAGMHLSHLSLMVLLLWDIPTGLAVKELRNPLMIVHHIGFALTAYYIIVSGRNTYYALCFFGVVEVSSVFLCIAEVFHPRHKEYTAWLETAPSIIKALNDAVRAVFVLAFLLVRGLYFPYAVWARYTPDMFELLALPLPERRNMSDAQLWTPFFLGSAFSVLQLYWGHLLIQQARKMLAAPKTEDGMSKKQP